MKRIQIQLILNTKIGNFVRISKIKKTFEKGYTPN